MKILIVKLGALGDVLRTTPLLSALHSANAGPEITWVVDAANASVLGGNPLIAKILPYSERTLTVLGQEYFDIAINLDKEPEALRAITAARSDRKMGFGRSSEGDLIALDTLSDYALRLGVDDELKFKINQKTYQEISFEQAGLKFQGEEYIFEPSAVSAATAKEVLRSKGYDGATAVRPVIGINTGSGLRFAGKRLPEASFARLAELFIERMNATVFLLGGEDEIARNLKIQKMVSHPILNTGSHPIHTFAAIVRECDLVISGDTTAMHVAIAVKVPVAAYFASTCPAEIELYGRGCKVVSSIECAPCYKHICPIDEQCMKDMDPEVLFTAGREVLKKKVSAAR